MSSKIQVLNIGICPHYQIGCRSLGNQPVRFISNLDVTQGGVCPLVDNPGFSIYHPFSKGAQVINFHFHSNKLFFADTPEKAVDIIQELIGTRNM